MRRTLPWGLGFSKELGLRDFDNFTAFLSFNLSIGQEGRLATVFPMSKGWASFQRLGLLGL